MQQQVSPVGAPLIYFIGFQTPGTTTEITIPQQVIRIPPVLQDSQQVETEALSPRREKTHKVKKEKKEKKGRKRSESNPPQVSDLEKVTEDTINVFSKAAEKGETKPKKPKRIRSITPPIGHEKQVKKAPPDIRYIPPLTLMQPQHGSGITLPSKGDNEPSSPRQSTSPKDKEGHLFHRTRVKSQRGIYPLKKIESVDSGLHHKKAPYPYGLPPIPFGREDQTSPRKGLVQLIELPLSTIFRDIHDHKICTFERENLALCRKIDVLLHMNLSSKQYLDEIFDVFQKEICHEGRAGANISYAWPYIMQKLRVVVPQKKERISFIIEMINRSGKVINVSSPFRDDSAGISLYVAFTKDRLANIFSKGCFIKCALMAISNSNEPDSKNNSREINKRMDRIVVSFLKNLSKMFKKIKKDAIPKTFRALNQCILDNIQKNAPSPTTNPQYVLLERFILRIITPELLDLNFHFKEKQIPGFEPVTTDLLQMAVKTQKIMSNIEQFDGSKKVKKYLDNIQKFLLTPPQELDSESSPDEAIAIKSPRERLGKAAEDSVRNIKDMFSHMTIGKDKEKEDN